MAQFGVRLQGVEMPNQNGFKNDAERLEALRKTQERMKGPEGLNYEEIIRESLDNFHTERELAYGFARVILGTTHREDNWWSRLKMERSFRSLEDEISHLQSCPRCKLIIMDHAPKAVEYLKIVPGIPRVVTLEDAEKALRRLAKINNMTEAELREWFDKIDKKIIREINREK